MPRSAHVFQWLTTGATYANGEPRGWKLHAVLGATEKMTGLEASRLPSACGLDPRPWGLDLFIEKKCARCLVAVGLACGTCRGKGSHGSLRDGTWAASCVGCGGTGEARMAEVAGPFPTPCCGVEAKPTYIGNGKTEYRCQCGQLAGVRH